MCCLPTCLAADDSSHLWSKEVHVLRHKLWLLYVVCYLFVDVLGVRVKCSISAGCCGHFFKFAQKKCGVRCWLNLPHSSTMKYRTVPPNRSEPCFVDSVGVNARVQATSEANVLNGEKCNTIQLNKKSVHNRPSRIYGMRASLHPCSNLMFPRFLFVRPGP